MTQAPRNMSYNIGVHCTFSLIYNHLFFIIDEIFENIVYITQKKKFSHDLYILTKSTILEILSSDCIHECIIVTLHVHVYCVINNVSI